MTTAAVVDASAIAAVIFREQAGSGVAEVLSEIRRLIVPPLFRIELANVARSKVHRNLIDWTEAEGALATVDEWPIGEAAVDWRSAWTTARKSSLTVYDACYLVVALEHDLPLITLDAALRSAAGRRSLL